MASLKNKTFEQIAAGLKLKVLDTEKLADYLKIDILVSVYRRNPKNEAEIEINKKVAKTYEEWTGNKFESFLSDSITPTRLVGPPGHGKTTVMRVAAKQVADALDMSFVQDPTTDFIPDYKSFIFVTQELSGENSSITMGGMPARMDVETPGHGKVSYMTKLPEYRLALLGRVGGGVLLLDDFQNAAPNVQNVALSVLLERRFQGVDLGTNGGTYVGVTGNLGALDGTYTVAASTAIKSRLLNYFTIDKLENFVNRVMNKYTDSLADVAIIPFLKRDPQSFASMPETGKDAGECGFACPRTWEKFVNEARKTLHKNGGRGTGEVAAYEEIRDKALSILGPEVGEKFAAYFHSMMHGADPLAYNTISEGKLNKEKIQQLYGRGTSAEQQQFGYQFSSALVDYAVNYIREEEAKGKDFTEGVKRFARGLYALQESEFAHGLNYFKDRLAAQVPKYAKADDGRSSKVKVLDSKWKVEIARIIGNSDEFKKDFTESHRNILKDTLSDSDKFQTTRRSNRM